MHVDIAKARQSQSDLLGSHRYCSIDAAVADRLGSAAGRQLHIRNTDTGMAGAFTVAEITDDGSGLRLAKSGRTVLGSSGTFPAEISPVVPRPDRSYQTTWRDDDIVETLWDDGQQASLVVCAPHGGDIEANTDVAAAITRKRLGADRASAWMVHAFGADAFDRFHVKSGRLHPGSYPGLASITGRDFERALSYHLWDGTEIIVGGLAEQSFRERLANVIREAVDGRWDVITEGGKYMGAAETNFVNWLTADGQSGVQIELAAQAAKTHRKRIARATADFFADRLE